MSQSETPATLWRRLLLWVQSSPRMVAVTIPLLLVCLIWVALVIVALCSRSPHPVRTMLGIP
jgi:hypothetical protein